MRNEAESARREEREDKKKSTDAPTSFDARDWARAFTEAVKNNPLIPGDKATMTAWFANALMRGWDERASRTRQKDAGE